MACIVQSCCCGCTLRTGSLVVAILSLIGSIYNIVSGAIGAVAGIPAAWGTVVASAVALIIAIMLLIGIQKNNRSLVMAWVWINSILIVINIALAITLIALGGIAMGVSFLIAYLISIYFIVVVYSFANVDLQGPVNMA
ncbi:uncharacterized protein LOC122260696 [Penaeus japonicus]|uniref:uncharacterized protein LOC122260696 n=1 Tax=Penaeus japonicus TaxID=27405 RepID=UPI001C7121FB|nr:uncharacterized protein LOC122260696 [Penaeus japonicus]